MKKFSIYAVTAAAALTMTGAMPFSALAAQNTYQMGRGNVIVIGGNGSRAGLGTDLSAILGNRTGGCSGADFGADLGAWSGGSSLGCLITGGSGSGCLGSGCLTPGSSNNQPSSGDATTTDSAAAEILSLVNAERARAGLAPLTLNAEVSRAAAIRANEIQASFSHTRPDGKSFSTVLTEAGISYRASGENIAYGQTTAEKVMSDWMNSSGHRANILNSGYTELGVGHVKDASGTDYWVQLFIN